MIYQGLALNEKAERVGIALTRYRRHENGTMRYRLVVKHKDDSTLTIAFVAASDILAALKMTDYLRREGIRLAL